MFDLPLLLTPAKGDLWSICNDVTAEVRLHEKNYGMLAHYTRSQL